MSRTRTVGLTTGVLTFLLLPTATAQCEVGSLVSDDPVPHSPMPGFGTRLALDGDVLVVSDPYDGLGGYESGAVFFYRRTAAGWMPVQKIVSDEPGAQLGQHVALSGTRALLSVPKHHAVHVYEELSGTWTKTAELVPPVGSGPSILRSALSGDRALVAADGLVHVFEKTGDDWSIAAELVSPDPGSSILFGGALDLDGEVAFVGDPLDEGGAAFAYRRNATGWELVQELPHTLPWGSGFGASIDVEGSLVVIGAGSLYGYPGGSAYVFTQLWNSWALIDLLEPGDSTTAMGFGLCVSLSDSLGERIVVGSRGIDDTHAAAHVFVPDPGGWSEASKVIPAQPDTQYWHVSVAVTGEALVICQAFTSEVHTYELADDCLGLSAFSNGVSLHDGGTQELQIDVGAAHAGQWYLVLGSGTGFEPGTSVDGHVLPLVYDEYFGFTATNPNSTVLLSSLGVLGPEGKATASLSIPPGSDPMLVGTTLYHAAILVSFSGPKPEVTFVSNPTYVVLNP